MKQYFLKAFFILVAAIVMEILPLSSTWGQELHPAYQDTAFWQETHEAYPLPMGMENGAPLISLDDIRYYYSKGIRYVTLTHGKDNHICDSSYDTTSTWGGLSPYGFQVIAEMNRIGMIIDVSHISDKTFYQLKIIVHEYILVF